MKELDPQLRLPKRASFWRKLDSHPSFSQYNRLVMLVALLNLVALAYFVEAGLWRPSMGMPFQALQAASAMVTANLSVAILIRQQYVVNLLFWLATRAPTHWPLWIRWNLAKVYHFGGLHSGCAVAATAWFAVLSGLLMQQFFSAAAHISPWLIAVNLALLSLLLLLVVMAQPTIRTRFHNAFERTHRFGGWSALLLFWAQTVLLSAAQPQPVGSAASGNALASSPAFWLLVLSTVSVLLPWLRLRRVAVTIERPSRHAAIAHFNHGVTPFAGSSTAISRSPLMEWHSFANIPTPGRDGFRLIISRAGDWTGSFIDDMPSHVWVKGITTAGVANIETLFKSVVYVATGSGIGPVLPHLLAKKLPMHLIWSTKNPRKTYGDALIEEILAAQPNALIWDTDEHGKPDLVKLASMACQQHGAEAVICIANQKLTRLVVQQMELQGIPAYGAIWDS